jgi:hypothetical protein
MNNLVSWFEMTKDIILPSLNIVAIVFIGTIIAWRLKKRDEKYRVKESLISYYNEFLNSAHMCINMETLKRFRKILLKIESEKNLLFSTVDDEKKEVICYKIRERINKTDQKLDWYKKHYVGWENYVNYFIYLLDKKIYKQELAFIQQKMSEFFKKTEEKIVLDKIYKEIMEEESVMDKLKSGDIYEIENSLDKMKHISYQQSIAEIGNLFEDYSQKVGDIIQDY